MKRLLAVVVLLAGCGAPPRPQATPAPRFGFVSIADSIIHASDLNQTHWGIEVFDPARNVTLYSFDANRHFIPASNTKIVVTTVAMGMLGPDFRYRTPVVATGAAGDSAIDRLVLVGSGDPTWSARFHASDFAVVEQLADSVVRAGVRRIRGELIIDASWFGPERVHSTWEVGDLPFSSAAPVAAVALGEGLISWIVTPGSARGAPASVAPIGPSVFPVRAQIVTDTARASTNVDIDYHSWPDSIVMTGTMRADRADTTRTAQPDAARFAAAAFAAALQRRGVTVANTRVVYDTLEAAQLRAGPTRAVASWTSPPMSEIVAAILKPSQNWIAEQVLKTLGASYAGRGTWARGIQVERQYLINQARVDSTAFFLRDASGLSAQNLLSPRAIIQILSHVRQQPWADKYRQGLPQPMMPRSTLSSRLQGLEGKVFAKTGTITNVNSLSGYVVTRSGRELIFSIMTNSSGRPSAQVRRAIDRLVMALAQERDWE